MKRFCLLAAVKWDDIMVYHTGSSAVLVRGVVYPAMGVTAATALSAHIADTSISVVSNSFFILFGSFVFTE